MTKEARHRSLIVVCFSLLTGATWHVAGLAAAAGALGILLFVDLYVDTWIRSRE